jgi:hypothetical protein
VLAKSAIDALAQDEALGHLSYCETFASQDSKELSAECKARYAEVRAKAVPGCGALFLRLSSLSTGSDRWTPVEITVDPYKDYYAPAKCESMPKTNEVSAPFRGLEAKVSRVCKQAGARLRFDEEWEHVPLDRGQVQRVATVSCWISGTRADWGTQIGR